MNRSLSPAATSCCPILVMAASAGLLTGLVEGALFVGLQELGWWHWSMAEMAVTREILWISPVFDLLLFSAVGLLVQVLEWKFPLWPLRRIAFGLFTFLLSLDWLFASGKIRTTACAVLAVGVAVTAGRIWPRWGQAAERAARKALPALAGITLLLLCGVQGSLWWTESQAIARLPHNGRSSAQPNVLVIVIDALRADHVGSYGYQRPTTPVIDRLAREGALFERAFAASSWTLASHASILTGHYCFDHGAENDPYDGRFPTIADALQKHGYRTAAFSANYIWFSRRRGLGQGFIRFEDYFNTPADMAARTLYGRKFEKFVQIPMGFDDWPARKSATQVTDATLRWIRKNPDVPYFAFLNYFDAHDPYLPPAPYRTKFSKLPNPGGLINDHTERNKPKMTAEQLQGEVDAYDGGILYADTEIGRLLAELDHAGKLANTLVVLTSDHGDFFGEHGLFVHRNALYRQVVHVPLILYGAGWGFAPGTRVAQPVSNASLPATILETLGSSGENASFVVPSLAPLWRSPGAAAEWPPPLMELEQMPFVQLIGWPAYDGRIKSLVTPEWQYIIHEKSGEELYRWSGDPMQQQNLADTPEGRAVAAEHKKKLQEMIHRQAIFPPRNPER